MAILFTGKANQKAAAIQDIFPTVSLRFQQPLAEQDIKTLQDSVQENTSGIFQLSFWSEQKTFVRNERNGHEAQANCILFLGEGSLIWPHCFLTGGYPGVGDRSGCAISSALAYEIFGSINIKDIPFVVGENTYIIRGVWDSKESALMCQQELANDIFYNMEIQMKTEQNYQEVAMDFMREHQLEPIATINGPVLGWVIHFISNFACYLVGAVLLIKFVSVFFVSWSSIQMKLVTILQMIIVGGLIFGLHPTLPAYLVPTKWSDFEFWGRFAQNYYNQLIELLSLTPTSKDLFFRLEFLKLGGYLLVGTISVTAYLSKPFKHAPFFPIFILVHIVWVIGICFCITSRFPVNIHQMYLFCCPYVFLKKYHDMSTKK